MSVGVEEAGPGLEVAGIVWLRAVGGIEYSAVRTGCFRNGESALGWVL